MLPWLSLIVSERGTKTGKKVSLVNKNDIILNTIQHTRVTGSLKRIISPDSYSAMLCPAKIQNCEKNTSSWAAREKAKLEQVSLSLATPWKSIQMYKY